MASKRLIITGGGWKDVEITNLKLSLSTSRILIGNTCSLVATITDSVEPTTIKAVSSNTSIATLSAGYVKSDNKYTWTVTGVAEGTATFTVTTNAGSDTEKVETISLAVLPTVTVSGKVNNGTPVTLDEQTVTKGSTVSFEVTPNDGYTLLDSDITYEGDVGKISVTEFSEDTKLVIVSDVNANSTLTITCSEKPAEK